MVALIERGAPRDFLDIFTLCQAELFDIAECWDPLAQTASTGGK